MTTDQQEKEIAGLRRQPLRSHWNDPATSAHITSRKNEVKGINEGEERRAVRQGEEEDEEEEEEEREE